MPINKKWSVFSREKLRTIPNAQGIYELGDINGDIVYIGSGDSVHGVKSRLYFHKNHKPLSVKYFRYQRARFGESPIIMEEEHCQAYLLEYGRLPKLQHRMPRGYVYRF